MKKFANDPLNWHGGRKARWANAMLEALDKIQGKISTIKTPFLVANGDADQLTKMDSPRFLYENAPSSDKTFKVRFLATYTIDIVGLQHMYRDR